VRSLKTLAIPAALLLVGFAYTSNSPIEADNNSFQLIEFLPEAGPKSSFFGDNDIKITANDAYAAAMFTSDMEVINYNKYLILEGYTMSKFIIIIVLGAMFTFGISNITQNSKLIQGTKNTVDNFSLSRAQDIAGSMTDVLLMRLGNNVTYRVTDEETEDLFGGNAAYLVEDAYFEGDSVIKITVAGEFNDIEKITTTYIAKPTDGWVPPVIRGAWTANGNLNNTISDMYIDGRDHDLSLNLLPKTGKFGVSSSVDFINLENAAIGGTNNGIDYPMTFPEVPEVIEENYDWGGSFPETPDEILGFPESTLKTIAQSGEHGSQYLYNPDKVKIGNKWFIDGLTYPLSGVTYIEMASADPVELMLMQTGNSGIIVVHKEDGDSHISGIKYDKDNSDGLFTGLLITDYSFHHHIDILGAVIMLSHNLETDKNCNGNKDHWVYYSSEAIEMATEITSKITGIQGTVGYGFANKRINVKHVYE